MTPERMEEILLQNIMVYVALLYRLRDGRPARLHLFDVAGVQDQHYHERFPRGSCS